MIIFEVEGMGRTLAKVASYKDLDVSKPMKKAGKFLKGKYENESFSTEGTLLGKRWAPLAKSTQRDRARRGYGAARPILVRTGKMKNNFQLKEGRNFVEISNPTEYFKYHQTGTSKMPARPTMGVTDNLAAQVTKIFLAFISKEDR